MTTQTLSPEDAEAEVRATHTGATCASCRLVLPQSGPQAMRTAYPGGDDVVFVSSQYPANQERFSAVRQTCLRMLSTEHVFNSHTPMIFADPAIGAALVLVFKVGDTNSRGQVRRYGVACLAESETLLVRAYPVIAPQLESIVKQLETRSAAAEENELLDSATVPDRFLRRRDRQVAARGLTQILNDDEVFVQIHAVFANVLAKIAKIEA